MNEVRMINDNRSSYYACTVKVGIPGFGDGHLRRLSHRVVISMTLSQLQVIVNDMLSQIECKLTFSSGLIS